MFFVYFVSQNEGWFYKLALADWTEKRPQDAKT